MVRTFSCVLREKLYSNCCFALPFGELYEHNYDSGIAEYSGRCSRCKEGAIFLTEEEVRRQELEEDAPIIYPIILD
jgi:hypothetical protein